MVSEGRGNMLCSKSKLCRNSPLPTRGILVILPARMCLQRVDVGAILFLSIFLLSYFYSLFKMHKEVWTLIQERHRTVFNLYNNFVNYP